MSPENTHPFLTGEWAFGHNRAVRPADGLLGPESMTAVCSHGALAADPAVPAPGPPEDLPGYFDLRWQQHPGLVVVSSEPLGDGD